MKKGRIYKLLTKDIKEYNKVFLGLVCLIILMTGVFTSVKISNSYAIFTDTIKGEKTITLTLDKNLDKSGANRPVLSDAMIPVYYDSTNNVWKKADKNNEDKDHKWYDYDKKMWANSVTYDHTKLYNEGQTIEGKEFNGTSDYIDMGYASKELGNKITLVARFKIKEFNDKNMKLISNIHGGGLSGLDIAIDHNTKKIYLAIFPKVNDGWLYSKGAIEKDKWYTVVGVFDGKEEKLYLNGELQATRERTEEIKVSTNSFKIGSNGNGSAEYFNGTISDALVIKEAIDENTIKKNYSGEVTNIDNPNQLFYTKFDNKIGNVNEAKYTKEGMTFDGNNDYVNVGLANYDFNNTITVAARFKTSVANNSDAQIIIANAEAAGTNVFLSKDNNICFNTYSQGKKEYVSTCSNIKAEKDQWYTVVTTYDGNSARIYVNGELKQMQESADAVIPSLMPYVIGATPDADKMLQYFKGTISDALVMKNALSEDEAKELSSKNNFNTYAKDENTLIYNNLRNYESRENGTEVPMDMISTMQVWIPRFNAITPSNYNGGTKDNPGVINVTLKNSNQTSLDAFNFGGKKLSGFWVGKFENSAPYIPTKEDNTEQTVIVKPDVQSWHWSNIKTFFNSMQKMTNNNNIYGFGKNTNTTLDTHIIKNSEWGAVAYLTHSKYGLCNDGKCREIYVNNSGNTIDVSDVISYTGRSSGVASMSKEYTQYGTYSYDGYKLNDNNKTTERDISKVASTTGNIYGVYDMSGGLWEYVMGNYNNELGQSGFTEEEYNSIKEKYVDVYTGTSYDGHALNETAGWYNDTKDFAISDSPWFIRSGSFYYSTGKINGIFYFGYTFGAANSYGSSRLVITNE